MKTIVIIDDDQLVLESIQDLLENNGFRTLTAIDGNTGLSLIHQHHPDLVLCDVQMPDQSGYDVLAMLRHSPNLQTTPFIFLTAKAEHVDQRHGMNLGADDYLAKPCSPMELLSAVNTRLEKQRHRQDQTQQQLDSLRSSISLALPHEFRTPLTGIFTSVELLRLIVQGKELELDVLEVADTIESAGRRLHRLIQNYLLYTKLEVASRDPNAFRSMSDEISLQPSYTITTVASEIASRNQRKDDLSMNLQNATIAISISNLEKIVTELVDNAFKFSPPQTPVQVTSHIEDDYYHLAITNHGRGLTSYQIARLGGYMQFDRAQYEQQGVGLGFAIAQRLVELNRGNLRIESVPQQATTVHCLFPLAALEAAEDDEIIEI